MPLAQCISSVQKRSTRHVTNYQGDIPGCAGEPDLQVTGSCVVGKEVDQLPGKHGGPDLDSYHSIESLQLTYGVVLVKDAGGKFHMICLGSGDSL